jgi:hypothetical protein
MNFNVNQPATLGQLAAIYNSPTQSPSDIDSQMFLANSQGQQWLQQQGRNLGIGDPAAYFQQQQLARQMAQTPSGAQMNAQQQAGIYSPQSLPGQLAARNSLADQASAQKQQEANQLASLQQANAAQRFPLPMQNTALPGAIPTMYPGGQPQLTPLQQSEAARLGQSPMAYTLNQRLGDNQAVGNFNPQTLQSSPFVQPNQQGPIDPMKLYADPSFQRVMQQSPDKAASVFQALTQRPLKPFDDMMQAQKAAQVSDPIKLGIAALNSKIEGGEAVPQADGSILWRQLIPNVNQPGTSILGSALGPANVAQKNLEQYLPYVAPAISQLNALTKAKTADAQNYAQAQAIAAARRGPSNYTPPEQPGTWANMVGGMTSDIKAMATGQPGSMYQQLTGGSQTQGLSSLQAAPITHAAPLLRNNPQFQQLLKSNPVEAQRMIMAIQHQGDAAMVPPTVNIPQGIQP